METITIRNVAKSAGVSIKTVSRVINNLPYVSDETRKKVWESVEKSGYIPSEEGKRLASFKKRGKIKTGNIGCILFSTFTKYSEPFFAELLEEIDKVLLETGIHNYFTRTLKELEDPGSFLKVINPNLVDGCIIIGIGEMAKAEIMKIKQKVSKIVILSDYLEDSEIPCVYPDSLKAGYLATQYLLSLNHKRIGCITGHLDWQGYTRLRLSGYKKALEEVGILYDEKIVREGGYSIEGAIEATKSLLEVSPLPTAIFVVSDLMAIGVYKAIQERGLKIPDDISVISSDDIRFSSYLHPALTTVGVDKYNMVKTAVRILIEEITGKRNGGVKIVLPVALIERNSCKRRKDKNG